ncbi:putative pterin-binding protein [Paracoccus sp. T5]|uniref:molybdopterin-dependent oxidoreductase n=1 Tax=Paracoccus sp. T5 TaxID=3402161 RepID=UPI003AE0B8F2
MTRPALIAAFAVMTAGFAATALPAASEEPILTVEGPQGTASYDLEALKEMEAVTFTTSTIWTDGPHEYTGVPLRDLLEHAGITEGSVQATAINDYAVEIPLDEVTEHHPIVAYHMDGEPMSIREKGPLWVIYPFDSDAALRAEVIYSRSIWQLARIAPAP